MRIGIHCVHTLCAYVSTCPTHPTHPPRTPLPTRGPPGPLESVHAEDWGVYTTRQNNTRHYNKYKQRQQPQYTKSSNSLKNIKLGKHCVLLLVKVQHLARKTMKLNASSFVTFYQRKNTIRRKSNAPHVRFVGYNRGQCATVVKSTPCGHIDHSVIKYDTTKLITNITWTMNARRIVRRISRDIGHSVWNCFALVVHETAFNMNLHRVVTPVCMV